MIIEGGKDVSKKIVGFYLLLVLFFSSSFFIGGIEEVEAKVCPLGYFPANDGYRATITEDEEGVKRITDFSLIWECKETRGEVKAEATYDNEPRGVEKFANYLSSFVASLAYLTFGIAALVVVYAGFLYTMSDGDAKNLQKAKLMIFYAAGGFMFSGFTFVLYRIIVSTILGGSPDVGP